MAVGAAVAAPDRRVVALEADGSALYTVQSWWTMAREGLDVTTVLLNNHSYAVLNMELDRVGADSPGPTGPRHARPRAVPTSTSCASPLGSASTRPGPRRPSEFADELARSLATPGPSVVEAVIPGLLEAGPAGPVTGRPLSRAGRVPP